jgi:hypothetical protein
MRLQVFRPPGLAVLLCLFVSAVPMARVNTSRADADQMLRKLALIQMNGLSARPASRKTAVTESEVNSFLAFHARSEIPAGIIDPAVSIDEAGQIAGTAIVDLDEVKKAQQASSSAAGMLALVSGRVPVEARGVLTTHAGSARFQLQSATVSGVPVPKTVLQQVVAYYTRGPATPDGIDLDAPFELPARIREIQTGKGQAVVVQ